MHELLFHRQNALEDDDLRAYAEKLDLDLSRFERDRLGSDGHARESLATSRAPKPPAR